MGARAVIALRVVLDTNVVLSALMWFRGTLEWLIASWHSRVILPLISADTTAELTRVLSYPRLGLTEDRQNIFLHAYIPWCEKIAVPEGLVIPPPRDPNDQPFLELALAGRADALVTGDNDLLVLSSEFSVPIITPRELRDRLVATT